MTTIPDHLDTWLRSAAPAPVAALRSIAGGGQRKTYFVETEGGPELVLQISSGGGPYDGTDITSLAREGRLFDALAGTGAAPIVPELVGVSPAQDAILTVRAPGDSAFDTVADPERRLALTGAFVGALARLHAVDSSVAAEVGFTSIGDGPGAATAWLDVWKNLFRSVNRPVPLIRFALQWLEANAPDREGPVVICHGDTGPGNFLFVGNDLTKLVDWELAHFGDFHNDLGMLAVRGFQLRGMEGQDEALARYARASGRRVDGWKVRYYRALSLILGLVTTLKQLDDAVATEKPLVAMPHYLHILPLFQGWLAEALLDLAGMEPEPVDLPVEETDLDQLDVALAFGGIDHVLADRSLAGGAVSFADLTRHLAARARYGRSVEAAELDDLERLLGQRPANVTQGKAALDAALQAEGLDHEALLRWAWRSSRRQSRLWPAWAAQYDKRLLPIADEYLP